MASRRTKSAKPATESASVATPEPVDDLGLPLFGEEREQALKPEPVAKATKPKPKNLTPPPEAPTGLSAQEFMAQLMKLQASIPVSTQFESQVASTQAPWSSVELHRNTKGVTWDIKLYFPPDWTPAQVETRLKEMRALLANMEDGGLLGRVDVADHG